MRIMLPLLLFWSLESLADEVVIYRCTDAEGALTLQDFPCASGQSQHERRYERPVDPPPPAYPAPAPSSPTEPGTPDPGDEPGQREPVPPVDVPSLFECRTFDGQDYFSERGDGNRRCVPLEITRIGAAPLPGAASACEWVVDDCTRLDPDAACAGWQRLHREALRAEREAFSNTLAEARADLARLAEIRDVACSL